MLETTLQRVIDAAEVWVWNQIIHSWVDPIFIAAFTFGLLYVLGRGLVWLLKYLDNM